MANLPVVGNVTGVYREDYNNNSDQNAFAVTCDNWRQKQGQLTSLSDNDQDSWQRRTREDGTPLV